MNMPRKVAELHRAIAARLKAAGIDTAMLDGRLIICHVTGLSDVDLIARPQTPVCDEHVLVIEEMIDRRQAGEPVSRLIGCKQFFGRGFSVAPATLDPRPDTEVLVETGVRLLRGLRGDRPARVLDIGTGTGAIVISLLAEVVSASGVATDISDEALGVCRSNAIALGVDDRLETVCTNWADGVTGKFDLVVANPPYIASGEIAGLEANVRNYDPGLALDGGTDGLDAYRAIFSDAAGLMRTDGHMLVEFGQGQHEAVVQIAARDGLVLADGSAGLIRDLASIIRCAVFKVC
ncbi:peptide chain release factor N(5)-glutamine methyltransferase [Anderseniella sp. Alg231-50]|uniref:peptide chain release factor N(5)-glutamine methyltransferase n=1 Tax=Anderseniella sp. Alg231-50 TaxID=1922226 RepID=UPI00307B384E